MHIDDYKVVFENDINIISEALNFYGTHAIQKYWMIMHDTDINKYGVTVHFLSKDESSTSSPLWSDPQDFPNHPIINIVLLNGYHYIKRVI
uniref:Uncharacterized protein n=1 Tax=Lactuca sativa TaxID=4236 RepID=A0A9R1VER8_LACSA|nr:hypothetical protein LSAT_V11C500229360 [Lactuca sativa]